MHEPTIVQEIWTYRCATCLHVWDVRYEAWHAGDGHGGDVVHYRRNGQRCVSPWSDVACANCGSYAVTPLPSPRSVRPAPPAPEASRPPQPSLSRLARFHAY